MKKILLSISTIIFSVNLLAQEFKSPMLSSYGKNLPTLITTADTSNYHIIYIDTTDNSVADDGKIQGFYYVSKTYDTWLRLTPQKVSDANGFIFNMPNGGVPEIERFVTIGNADTSITVAWYPDGDVPTDKGVAYWATSGTNQAGRMKGTAALTNGQMIFGSTGAAPVVATMSGDAAVSAAGALTIANDAVTFAKFQNITDVRLLGRSAGSSGDMQEITVGAGLSLSGGALTASAGATIWNDLGDANAPGSVAFGVTEQIIDGNTNDVTAAAQDMLSLNYTNDGVTDVLTQRILVLNKLAASTNAVERGLVIDNKDAAALDAGIEIVGTSTGAVTTALKLDDAEIGTWANIGANDLVTAATTLASTELDRLDGKDAALIDLNDSPVVTGAWDFGGATSLEVPNGADPTVSVAGQISIDTEGTTESAIRFYADEQYVLPARQSKSFTIVAPVATDDYPVWKVPYAITIRAIHVLCVGGTNIVGGLDEADGNGASSAAIDADITSSAGSNANDDGTLSNPTLDAADYLMWHTTSISGTPTSVTVTLEYTIDSVN